MAIETRLEQAARSGWWRWLGWGGAAALLITPLVAMQFTSEVNWTAGDFMFAGFMFAAVGIVMELTVRASRSIAYRAGVGFALASAFFLIWVNLAVGIIGDEDNPANLMFFGVVLIGIIGSIAARFRPRGMAVAMSLAAAAQLLVDVTGFALGLADPPPPLPAQAMLIAMFAAPMMISAALFRKAAEK
jgi:MFS family permease